MASTGLEVRETGCALRVQTEAPHLVSMGSDRLSTAITLHPLPQGRTVIGSSRNADVVINDTSVEPVHCTIENNDGIVTLDPIDGLTSVDNTLLNSSVRLTQGCTLTIGRSNYFRFNDPAEAEHLKSVVLANSRNSMAPARFRRMEEDSQLEHKPPVVPRKSPRNSYSSDDEGGFLGKLNKFEMLARQSSRSCVSPKVFPVGSLTANVPADQILRHSRSPSAGSLSKNGPTGPFQNLTNVERSRSSTPSGEQRSVMSGRTTAPSLNHVHASKTLNLKTSKTQQYNDENNDYDLMSRSLTLPRRNADLDCFNREFDMSQSLIVAKTSSSDFLNQCGSNPNLHQNSCPVAAKGYSNTCCRRIKAPSPAFNRNPRYVEPKKVSVQCVKSPMSGSSTCSLEELRERQMDAVHKRKMAENRRVQAHEDRIKEQECEKQEKIRLEEILAMCAEYEKQSTVEKPRHNRIITNGSLPRDKRPGFNSPFGSPKSQPNHLQFIFDLHRQNSNLNGLNHNGNVNHNNSHNSRTMIENHQDLSPNNNIASKWNPGFCNSLPRSRNSNYENVCTDNPVADICYEKPRFERKRNNPTNGNVSVYENVRLSGNNDFDELADSKIAVSNDDLLEAIEQLSMLSKGKSNIQKKEATKDFSKSNDKEDRKKQLEFLRQEKAYIMSNMEVFKRNVTDIEAQEEDINRELELEKALLSAEMESESLKLAQDEMEKTKVQSQIAELEEEMSEHNAVQLNLQVEAKQRVHKAQQACVEIEEKLAKCNDQCLHEELSEKLNFQQDVLETERKAFEDLEFHHLEEEASKLATREELQRYLSELSTKIESRTNTITQLEAQKEQIQSTVTKEAKSLERQKLGHMRRLEEGRNRLRAIEDELHNSSRDSYQNMNEQHSPSREDLDRISKVTNESPIVGNEGSLGPKTVESLKEIERNRQLHLAIQGRQVISEERRKVEELKRRVQAEVRFKWEERKMNCASFNSVESGEESSSYSTGPTESGSGNSDGAEGANSDKLSPSKLSEITSPSPGPSNNSYTLLQNDNIRDERKRSSADGERFGSGINGNGSRPLSQTSSEMDTYGLMPQIKHREKAKIQRPLTRYLPIKSESLNLREFVEAAGHQLSLINDVEVDKTSCRGYLSKMSKKFHHWNKRWFVFDRAQKTISYYADNGNRKTRGVIYFQSIEHVYIDYMNSVKSPQPQLTFIVKTSSRLYHLMASSAEAMRVWVDVVFTGAEGYREFDHGA